MSGYTAQRCYSLWIGCLALPWKGFCRPKNEKSGKPERPFPLVAWATIAAIVWPLATIGATALIAVQQTNRYRRLRFRL